MQQVGLKEDVFFLSPPFHTESAAPVMPRSSCPLKPCNDANSSLSGIRANSDSDNKIDCMFNTVSSDDNLTLLCCEEGVKFLYFLLSKADELDGPTKSNICDWTFHDLA
jgi:hypothetical protein